MSDKEALQAFKSGKQLNQATIKRLYGEGYIEVRNVSTFDSAERELLPTFITEKGRKLLEG